MGNRYKQLYECDDSIAVSKLIYDDGELLIQGFDRHNSLVVELCFLDILIVRISDEGVRLRLLEELGALKSFVLVDENSQLLTWTLEESLHTRDTRLAKHFIVLVGEEIYDVVSFTEPRISRRNN
ncbi:hypothetical protein ACH5Y9_25435 (plasmid) [Methylomonas sp. BW4-1]|uniref:hypothetical protein n=1 Tax=Methylomonas sp. BW4-1 TaxID=3376685 RepID=UPI0040435631